MKDYKKLLGNKIRELRKRRGFKTSELANIIGVSAGTYRNIESGGQLPSSRHLYALCRLYKCDIDEILWKESWGDLILDKSDILDSYIYPIINEFKDIERKAKVEAERNILNGIMTEVEKYRDLDFTKFVKGDDYLDILESLRSQMEIRVSQLHRNYLKSKNQNKCSTEIAPNGVIYEVNE